MKTNKPSQSRVPKNTERQTRENPLPFFLDALAGGSDRAIRDQEASGQLSFVGSDTLPTKISAEDKEILVKVGVQFLGSVDGDPIFQNVVLPNGWEKKATGHDMWSDLLDNKGRKRAGIFYKAAFYDRSAHLSLNTRFRIQRDYDRQNAEGVAVTRVMDGDTSIYETKPRKLPPREAEGYYGVCDESDQEARIWLQNNFPQYKNPSAYWE